MASDPSIVHRLSTVTRTAEAAAQAAGRDLRFDRLPDFTVLVLGPVDAGKTALVRALCDDVVGEFRGIVERPGRETPVPVEFVPGARVEMFLGLGGSSLAPGRWARVSPADRDALRTAGLRRARVVAPARALLDWQLRLVDTPGIDTAADLDGDMFDEARQPGVGVLYVVPSRGTTDLDIQALERLRGVPTVLVENLRDTELIASRASLDELTVSGLSTTHAVPIAIRRLAWDSAERELLRRCTALLRTLRLPGKLTARLGHSAAEAQSGLRADYARRLDGVLERRHTTDPLDRLRLAAELWRVERDGPVVTALDGALAEVTSAVRAVPSPERLRAVVGADARTAMDRYNVEAARNTVDAPHTHTPAAPTAPEDAAFARSYVAVRKDLLAAIDNIAADGDLDLTAADRRSLATAREYIVEDRIEVALLGQFSSGKSSLINALLGVPPTEKFLPAKPRPTTATVNRVVYREKPSIEAVWRDEIELNLLLPSGDDNRLRASVDEIRALGTWLRDGTVRAEDCTFRSVDPEGVSAVDQLRAFADLWKLLEMDHPRPHVFAYVRPSRARPLLTDTAVPTRVTVHRFARHPERWADGLDVQAAFAAVSDWPALALQIDELRVGSSHPLLHHVSIIDTPGTDAPIPHHLLTARRAVSDKPQCVVVYCFNGAKPSSAADASNLTFLRDINIGGSRLSRFFFAITQKGNVPIHHQPEVRGVVRAQLDRVGVKPSRLYFTEVMHGLNDEFQELSADVNQFVAASKGPLLQSWILHARDAVTTVHTRHQHRLDDIDNGERSRLARLEALRTEAKSLQGIREEFERSPVWGVPWLRARGARAVDSEIEALDDLVEELTTREAFDGIADHLTAGLDDLNEAARRSVYGGCSAIADKLRTEVGTRLRDRTIAPPELQHTEEFFPTAGVAQAVDGIGWRSGWERVKGLFRSKRERWNEDIDTNRDRVGGAWRSSRNRGRVAADDMVERRLKELRAELTRVADAIDDEIAVAARPPSKEEEAVARTGQKRASTWLRRLDALGRTVEGDGA